MIHTLILSLIAMNYFAGWFCVGGCFACYNHEGRVNNNYLQYMVVAFILGFVGYITYRGVVKPYFDKCE